MGGPPRIIVYFDDLPDRYKKQIESVLGKGKKKQLPPKAFSNYGEIMDNGERWTVGKLSGRDRGAKTRTACGKPMHHWMILAFHKDRDAVDRWIEKKLEILHMDGDKNKDGEFHPWTHEDRDDSKPYTNYYFTLRLGTRDQNQQEKWAKRRRLNNEAPDTQPIACRQDNLKRAQSKSWKRYEAYKSATTIAEFLEKGGLRRDLKHDLGKGYVRYISTPQAQ